MYLLGLAATAPAPYIVYNGVVYPNTPEGVAAVTRAKADYKAAVQAATIKAAADKEATRLATKKATADAELQKQLDKAALKKQAALNAQRMEDLKIAEKDAKIKAAAAQAAAASTATVNASTPQPASYVPPGQTALTDSSIEPFDYKPLMYVGGAIAAFMLLKRS